MSKEYIQRLLTTDRYNVEILPQLEAYLQRQIETQTSDIEANLAILKLYQFHPEKVNVSVMAKILTKALMSLPNADFTLCMYLIPEKFHNEEPVKTLATLADMLETCQFKAFWKETTTCREFLGTVGGFDQAIRTFVLSVLTITYQNVSKQLMQELMNFTNVSELDQLISSNGWEHTADTVTFPHNEDNQAKSKKIADKMSLEHVQRFLQSVGR
eukprot:GILJ01001198.1.p1 GENE.GILJ01001198.1~~GILJ01001198.1.p1  ORF type:complete len:239 (-),score=34.81 GILJ01001198.1:205-846(-)